jgi:hypothetical protein
VKEDEQWWSTMLEQLFEQIEFDDFLGADEADDARRIEVVRRRDPELADLAVKQNEVRRAVYAHVRAKYAAELKARHSR